MFCLNKELRKIETGVDEKRETADYFSLTLLPVFMIIFDLTDQGEQVAKNVYPVCIYK